MILSKFRDRIVEKKIEKELRNSDKSQITISDGKINSILVFTDKTKTDNSKRIIAKELNIDISKIKTINYIRKVPKELNSERFLSDKDFNWFGNIKNKYIQNLINTEFDLLINLSVNNQFFDYLVVLSNAKFKVGFSSADNRLYNFMIDVNDKDVTVFSRELKKYLEILNKL